MNNELNIPKHVGIIMDGNGRWAQERGMVRTMGHKNAIKTLKELCIHSIYSDELGHELVENSVKT